ncbi:hypothetical protein EYR41_006153 [Orbilia oligospora]|uniref:DDT domain-containing protein n=1 Tax=Orbilia oligospora TaxID=2813651 RepID=A0A8H2HV89_ORBOL|nr:hypothetical protein EYR41_006153 [Orbilia oligospora]
MVLFKRKPVQFLPTPEIADDDQEVWVIDATGEIFTEYEDYLARMQFYKGKRFICEITGHSGLDFFSALESELAGSKDVEESFPDALKGPILKKVQFQTIPRIDNLVDLVYDAFKGDFYPGEHVIATLHNNDKTEGQIREKSSFPEQTNAQGEVSKPATAVYTVSLINRGTEISLGPDDLTRDRRIFTKAMLRAFIKNTVHREAWNGAPWLVKESYARRYCISQMIPRHLQRGSTVAERKAMLAVRKAQAEKGFSLTIAGTGPGLSPDPTPPKPTTKGKGKQKDVDGKPPVLNLSSSGAPKIQAAPEPPKPPPKPLIKYPIEDLTIMPSLTPKKRPTLKRLHEVIPGKKLSEESVPLLLETWQFLNVYCEPLLLDSFTFDDFIEALFYNDDHQDCLLLLEIHCSLLKALVDEGEEGKVNIASILDLDTDGEEDEEEEEEEEDRMQTRRSSARFKELSKAAINGHGDNQNPVWLELLRKRDFQHGGWETIIVGLFSQISNNKKQFKPFATDILRYFSPLGEEPLLITARAQYRDLDINIKIKIIQLLQKLIFETPIVREYMDECGEAMTKLRKDKIEHQKTRKVFIEELKSLEDEKRQLLPENEPSSPIKEEGDDTKMSNGYDTPEVENDDDSDSSRPVIRRPSNRAAERKRKREQEKEKEEANAKIHESQQKYKRACLNVEKTKAKIRQEEAAIAELDSELRESDCARLRLLGKDRFWNRYWFFERNGMPYAGIPTSSTADSGFAMGRLWIQGAPLEEQKEFLDLDRVINNDTNDGTRVAMSIKERRKKEEGNAALRGPEKWAYIDDPEDFNSFLEWLDTKGERELKLKKELEIYKEHIVNAMEARQRYLNPSDPSHVTEVVVRMSTRTKSVAQVPVQRCLKWKNNLAAEHLGHYHSEQPVRTKGRKGQQESRSSRNSRTR